MSLGKYNPVNRSGRRNSPLSLLTRRYLTTEAGHSVELFSPDGGK